MDHQTEAPQITREERHGAATIRLRANAKRTLKEGWSPSEMTVEFTGEITSDTHGLFRDKLLALHTEIDEACQIMNSLEE